MSGAAGNTSKEGVPPVSVCTAPAAASARFAGLMPWY